MILGNADFKPLMGAGRRACLEDAGPVSHAREAKVDAVFEDHEEGFTLVQWRLSE